jgi:hypothetical protein
MKKFENSYEILILKWFFQFSFLKEKNSSKFLIKNKILRKIINYCYNVLSVMIILFEFYFGSLIIFNHITKT